LLNIALIVAFFPELIINEEMVLKQLNSLKIDKSPEPDELHPRLLKELAKSLTKPLRSKVKVTGSNF
jgi:hypothetical protein